MVLLEKLLMDGRKFRDVIYDDFVDKTTVFLLYIQGN